MINALATSILCFTFGLRSNKITVQSNKTGAVKSVTTKIEQNIHLHRIAFITIKKQTPGWIFCSHCVNNYSLCALVMKCINNAYKYFKFSCCFFCGRAAVRLCSMTLVNGFDRVHVYLPIYARICICISTSIGTKEICLKKYFYKLYQIKSWPFKNQTWRRKVQWERLKMNLILRQKMYTYSKV